MKGKIFFALLLGCLIGWTLFALSNPTISLRGIFPINNGWSGDGGTSYTGGGYPGRVNFDVGSGMILSDGTLSGAFWLGNVWWVSFSHGVAGSSTQIVCPTTIWTGATQPCPMSGYAWSQNAGWIAFSGAEIGGTSSGAYFNPNTGNIEWWGWSRSLGWIPMWTSITGSALPTAITEVDPLAGVPINFVSKIAIVGNIAGSRVFSVENNGKVNQDVGYSYKTINHANILNMIRRNIALMTRNIDDATLALATSPFDFIIRKWADYRIDSGWTMPSGKKSIIVIGGDIVMDQVDVNSEQWINRTIGLISLKDPVTGNGGNIVISDQVKRIYAYLYAEGSIFSWEKTSSVAPIIKYSNFGIWNIPQNQLYIRGLMASKNTIGGSQQTPPVCPALVVGCNQSNVYSYDWDYFRTYNPLNTTQSSLPSQRSSVAKIKDAVMVIEYDPAILTDPPPWFAESR